MFVVADSNLFHGRIKVESSDLLSLLEKVSAIGWQFAFPQPSIMELESGALKEYDKAEQTFKKSVKQFNRIFVDVEEKHTDKSSFLELYRTNWNKFVKQHNVEIIPFPTSLPKTEDLFQLAVNKEPPFDSTGNSYRDVIIFHSVKEFAEKHSTKKVFFITRDDNFLKAASVVTTKNLECGTQEFVTNAINEVLTDSYKEREERLSREIMGILSENLKGLEKQARNDISFDVNVDYGETLLGINSFKIDEIVLVSSIAQSGDNKVSFSGTAIGKLEYQVETFKGHKDMKIAALNEIAQRPCKVGESVFPSMITSLLEGGKASPKKSSAFFNYTNPFDKIIETRSKYEVIDFEGEATLKDDTATELHVTSIDSSTHSPFEFINLDGSRKVED